jgi:integrase
MSRRIHCSCMATTSDVRTPPRRQIASSASLVTQIKFFRSDDLAYLTGRRPADTLKFAESDIRRGELWVEQGKRGKKLRITVTGELAVVIDRIRARKAECNAKCDALVVNEVGERLMRDALRFLFDRARLAAGVQKDLFQFRDLRAKAGTDKTESTGDIRSAQRQLGRKTLSMTEHYVRERKDDKASPTR